MRKLYFIYAILFLGLLSCDYGEDFDGVKEEIMGGPVQAVYVSPTSGTLYVDSELPTMRAFVAPIHAADSTVTWMSDHPEILSVNAETGELSWGTITNSEVVITAVSNNNSNATGSCTFTVRNYRNNYGYIDARASVELWILDRNIGATATPEEDAAWTLPPSQRTAAGNHYQWGNNNPIANIATGGANNRGWGDTYAYYETNGSVHRLNSGLPGIEPYWSVNHENFLDWSNGVNLPGGMDGWRLPTKEELERIAYYMNEDNFRDADGKRQARLLWTNLGFVPASYIRQYRVGYLDFAITTTCVIWSSEYDPSTGKAWCLMIYGYNNAVMQELNVAEAANLRLVRDANSFDVDEDGQPIEE